MSAPGYPDVDYLSATLELTESGNGETNRLRVAPRFDEPRIEFEIEEDPAEDAAFLVLNRRQVECLADFLTAWLARSARESAAEARPDRSSSRRSRRSSENSPPQS